jgi:hypothetical protein
MSLQLTTVIRGEIFGTVILNFEHLHLFQRSETFMKGNLEVGWLMISEFFPHYLYQLSIVLWLKISYNGREIIKTLRKPWSVLHFLRVRKCFSYYSLSVDCFFFWITGPVKYTVFSDVAPCSHVEVDRRFRGSYCSLLYTQNWQIKLL